MTDELKQRGYNAYMALAAQLHTEADRAASIDCDVAASTALRRAALRAERSARQVRYAD
ncbi:hypothetical protein ACVSQB_32965 [Bradyrhizobium elkanii]